MEKDAIQIVDSNRIMSIATVRPDGWPQATIVGYANSGFSLYFLIYRTSQKFRNIASDSRVRARDRSCTTPTNRSIPRTYVGSCCIVDSPPRRSGARSSGAPDSITADWSRDLMKPRTKRPAAAGPLFRFGSVRKAIGRIPGAL